MNDSACQRKLQVTEIEPDIRLSSNRCIPHTNPASFDAQNEGITTVTTSAPGFATANCGTNAVMMRDVTVNP